jgi:hypothetical protein
VVGSTVHSVPRNAQSRSASVIFQNTKKSSASTYAWRSPRAQIPIISSTGSRFFSPVPNVLGLVTSGSR